MLILILNREISNKKKTQKLNKDLEKALIEAGEANMAKSNFLFNMSHDIRTPMNAIIGFRDLLEKYQDDPLKRQDYLDKIKNADDILLSIINNVLEMTRIEQGNIEVNEIPSSIDEHCENLDAIFRVMMEEKGIEFTREVNVTNHYVYSDVAKVREIFINLISNAYKYTEKGGKVSIIMEEIPCEKEGYTTYKTRISDTGIGMSEEFLPHIFEEFTREQNTTDAKVEGTGLGMPIVKRLVELLGGTIEVQSTKNVGTTFIVELTHKIADVNECLSMHNKAIDPCVFVGKRILLAEDNELNAEIAKEILKEAGFEIDHAWDGRECIQMLVKADSSYYDLILMDIQMPNMNGYESSVMIRKLTDKQKAKIPIIAMTANAFEEDKKEAYRCGMNGHVAKPIDVDVLLSELSKILNK